MAFLKSSEWVKVAEDRKSHSEDWQSYRKWGRPFQKLMMKAGRIIKI